MSTSISPQKVRIFAGRFGSGKTEVSINYCLWQARHAAAGAASQPPVFLVDLDVVTPYFRSRESADWLLRQGVEVVAPSVIGRYLDVPAITPQILGAIQDADRLTILDVGGDRQGARVLGMFSTAIAQRGYELSFVVNPYRPFTDSVEGLSSAIAEIEASSRLRVSDLVSNPNLMQDTELAQIVDGHEKIEQFARQLSLPVSLVCIERRWANLLGSDHFAQPVLVLDRFFVQSWEPVR